MPDGISDSIGTTGRVTVGSSVTGEIETANDRDAYAVELVAGRTYRIDLEGAATGKGTLADPFLRWLRDSSGNGLHGTRDHDGGEDLNARQVFTPQVSGTYYISARGNGASTGTYTLSVTEVGDPPAFGQQSYAFDLAENTDGSTNRVSLGTVSATDPENATVTYSIAGGNESGSFEIEEASGELFYKGSGEDYESDATSYDLTVRASDGQLTTDITVTINVTDVAETPTIRVADAETTEGDDTEMLFRVTLASASSGTVTVNYATADGTAVAGEDYTATSGTLTFAPGETEKTVAVTIVDDTVEDSEETFRLVLSDPSGATLADSEAVGTILNTETTVSEAAGEDLPADVSTAGVVPAGGSATGKIGGGRATRTGLR